MPALLPVPALPHILHKIPLTKHPVRPAPSSELHLLGEDPGARLLNPNRARPRLGHPSSTIPYPANPPAVATAPCPSRVTALGDNDVAAGAGTCPERFWASPAWGQPGEVRSGRAGSVSPHRCVAKPRPAPLLGLTGENIVYASLISAFCFAFAVSSKIGSRLCQDSRGDILSNADRAPHRTQRKQMSGQGLI